MWFRIVMTGMEDWGTEKVCRGLGMQDVEMKNWICGRKDNGVENGF